MTSNYFRTYDATNEQRIIESLVQESVSIIGQDMFYLPKTYGNKDPILQASTINYFNEASMIDVYLESVEGFSGEQSIMSKFGLEIRDSLTFVIAKKTFEETTFLMTLTRPREGDLIFYPKQNKCFQIMYVDNKPQFYPLGTLPSYRLRCELFEYSNEIFNTGIDLLDTMYKVYSLNELDHALLTADGTPLLTEDGSPILTETIPPAQDIQSTNIPIQQAANTIIDHSQVDPFAELKF